MLQNMTIGQLLFSIQIIAYLFNPLSEISQLHAQIISQKPSFDRVADFLAMPDQHMLSVNWCRPSMWMPRISPAESGCSTSILSMMGWGISLWMNWKQKKRRDRSHAKSAPLWELLQILFYGNSATRNALLYISLLSVAFGRVRPGRGAPCFFTMLHHFLRAASGIRHQHESGSDAAHPGIVPIFCAGMPCKLARKQCHFPAYCPILSA